MAEHIDDDAPFHKPGYLEKELRQIIRNSDGVKSTHAERVFAEVLLVLLQRTRDAL